MLYYICRNGSLPKSHALGSQATVPLINGYFIRYFSGSIFRQSRPSPVILPIFQTIFLSVSNSTIMSSKYFSHCRLTSWLKVFRAKMLMDCLDFPSLWESHFCSWAFKELSSLYWKGTSALLKRSIIVCGLAVPTEVWSCYNRTPVKNKTRSHSSPWRWRPQLSLSHWHLQGNTLAPETCEK